MKKLTLSTTGCICLKLKRSMTQTLLGEIETMFVFSTYVRDDPQAAEEVSGVDSCCDKMETLEESVCCHAKLNITNQGQI